MALAGRVEGGADGKRDLHLEREHALCMCHWEGHSRHGATAEWNPKELPEAGQMFGPCVARSVKIPLNLFPCWCLFKYKSFYLKAPERDLNLVSHFMNHLL